MVLRKINWLQIEAVIRRLILEALKAACVAKRIKFAAAHGTAIGGYSDSFQQINHTGGEFWYGLKKKHILSFILQQLQLGL